MESHEWLSTRKISRARACLRECEDNSTRAEGLACLRNARPEYLCNLIHADHPDRRGALRWLKENC